MLTIVAALAAAIAAAGKEEEDGRGQHVVEKVVEGVADLLPCVCVFC